MILQSFENVYIELIIYSAALAVIVGMIFSRNTGRDPSWIIIAVALSEIISLLRGKMVFFLDPRKTAIAGGIFSFLIAIRTNHDERIH